MPSYTVNVVPLAERKAKINSKIGEKTERRVFRAFSRPLNLPIIGMPLDELVYRMRNGRTRMEQAKYVRDNNKSPTFFVTGEDNVSAQRVQHELLLELSNTDKGNVLGDVLIKEKEQTEPLLITREGVVLNGNRRLATMRELVAKDRERNTRDFERFLDIECLVLDEGISDAQMREIELRLQGARDTKLAYDWINEALLARDSKSDGKLHKDVADAMNMNERDLEDMLRRLDEAELYVRTYHKDSYGNEGTLDLLRDAKGSEQQFIELVKSLRSVPVEKHDDARAIHYVLTANPAEAGSGRKYDYREAFQPKNITTVLEKIAKRENIAVTNQPDINDNDPWADDSAAAGSQSYAPVIAWLTDRNGASDKAKLIREITQDIVDERSDQNRESRALRLVKDAATQLKTIELANASRDTYSDIESTLCDIEQSIAAIRSALQAAG